MAKIHSFSDTFANFTNWEDGLVVDASVGASGGLFTGSINSSTGSHYAIARLIDTSYELNDTWMTVECVDYVQAGQSGVYSFLGIMDDFNNPIAGMLMSYEEGTDEIVFRDLAGSPLDTIPNPGTSIHLALDLDETDGYTAHYSLDGGDNWVQFHNSTYDIVFGQPHHAGIGFLVIGTGPFTLTQDNFNVATFPHSTPPIEIDVDPAEVTAIADPRIRVLVGPYLTVDAPAAEITVAVLLEDPLLTIKISVDPAEITVVAEPYDSITFGAPYVTFTPAQIQVTVNPPLSIDLGEADPVIEVITANVDVAVNLEEPIVGTFVIGNPFAYPHTIIESGSQVFDMNGMNFELGEADPELDSYTFLPWTKTQWIKYVSQTPAQLTVNHTGGSTYGIQAFDGTSLEDLIEIGRTTDVEGPLVVDINSGVTYIRISTSTEATTVTLTWSYVPSYPPLFMDILTPEIDYSPDSITVSIQGGDSGEDIQFVWAPPVSDLITGATPRPITLTTISSDFEGNILVGSLEIPAVYAGDYTLTATGLTSGRQATGSFTVLNDPLDQDTEEEAVEPVASLTVHWLWDDGNGHTWIMPKNPERMTSVIKKKALLAERTTAGIGQHIIWQGATPALSWSFNGTITTEDEYDELVFFHSLNRKFYITDHRNRTFIVTVRSLQMTPRRNSDNFWTFDYEVNCFMYEEVTL